MENNPSTGSGHGNNFFSGFLFGMLVGAAIVFLLATKKGKRILKIISEKGIGNISNLLDEESRAADLETYEDDEVALKKEVVVGESVGQKPKVRRFFRGIPRHLN